MITEPDYAPSDTTVDLTGRLETVIREVERIVADARHKQNEVANSPRNSLRGRFAELGISISKEEIDANKGDAALGLIKSCVPFILKTRVRAATPRPASWSPRPSINNREELPRHEG